MQDDDDSAAKRRDCKVGLEPRECRTARVKTAGAESPVSLVEQSIVSGMNMLLDAVIMQHKLIRPELPASEGWAGKHRFSLAPRRSLIGRRR